MPFPFHKQFDAMDCGPACLRMVAEHYGKRYSLQELRRRSYIDREGVSIQGTLIAAESIGFQGLPVKIPFQLEDAEAPSLFAAPLPAIGHWNQNHFVVIYKLSKKHVWIADPARGKVKLTHAEFKRHWCSDGEEGVALLLEEAA